MEKVVQDLPAAVKLTTIDNEHVLSRGVRFPFDRSVKRHVSGQLPMQLDKGLFCLRPPVFDLTGHRALEPMAWNEKELAPSSILECAP